LNETTKSKAMQIIDQRQDLLVWQEDSPELLPQRRKVLERLKQQLMSPQPPEKKVKHGRFHHTRWRASEFKKGDLVSYQLPNGEFALLWLFGECKPGTDYIAWEHGSFHLLLWKGRVIPSTDELKQLTYLTTQPCWVNGSHAVLIDWIHVEKTIPSCFTLVARTFPGPAMPPFQEVGTQLNNLGNLLAGQLGVAGRLNVGSS
jgi:hypothetical protein